MIQFNVEPLTLILLTVGLVGAYVYFWAMHRRSLTDMGTARKRLALGIRLIIVTLLFLALAQTRWVQKNDALAVTYLLDASRSIRPEQTETQLKFAQESPRPKGPH